nr:MAG TPA: hypothetical protein [Caudoviricetes sp.]
MNVCSYVQLVKYQIYECMFICTNVIHYLYACNVLFQ